MTFNDTVVLLMGIQCHERQIMEQKKEHTRSLTVTYKCIYLQTVE